MNLSDEENNIKFMREALKEAQLALEKDEIPVGCVIVCAGKIIARGHNLTELLNDVTAHAEMQAITAAANYLGGKYLRECTMYVTLEPCVMCAGALNWSQIGEIFFGASDEKRGFHMIHHPMLHPKTKIKGGILAKECGEVLTKFFHSKRN